MYDIVEVVNDLSASLSINWCNNILHFCRLLGHALQYYDCIENCTNIKYF